MLANRPISPFGSSSLVDGSPFFLSDMADYHDGYDFVLMMAADQAAQFARTELRRAAANSDSYREYADVLDVVFNGVDFDYVVDGTDEQIEAVMTLEYGDEETRPEGLIRRFAERQRHTLSMMLTDYMSGAMPVA